MGSGSWSIPPGFERNVYIIVYIMINVRFFTYQTRLSHSNLLVIHSSKNCNKLQTCKMSLNFLNFQNKTNYKRDSMQQSFFS